MSNLRKIRLYIELQLSFWKKMWGTEGTSEKITSPRELADLVHHDLTLVEKITKTMGHRLVNTE